MHVSPVKHIYICVTTKNVWLPDRHTEGQTDARQSDPYMPYALQATQKGDIHAFIPTIHSEKKLRQLSIVTLEMIA